MNLLKLNEYGINIKLEIFRGLKYECIQRILYFHVIKILKRNFQ